MILAWLSHEDTAKKLACGENPIPEMLSEGTEATCHHAHCKPFQRLRLLLSRVITSKSLVSIMCHVEKSVFTLKKKYFN